MLANTKEISSRLRDCMQAIESQVSELRGLLMEADVRSARVFKLPRTRVGEEHDPYEHLTSEKVEGPEAVALTANAFSEFYGGAGESTKAVYRLPGAIALAPGSNLRILKKVQTINETKERFAKTAQELDDRNVRFEVVHRLFPMLITLQATRQIQCYAEETRSVTFTWGRKSAIRVVERDEVLDTLKNLRSQKPLVFEEDRWQEAINEDMVRLLSLPRAAQLRYRRDLKVRPMANLLLSDGTKWLREANMPIIIMHPGDDFRTGVLPDFDANEKPKRGRKNPQRLTEDDRFLNCLPVYRAKDS